MNFKVISINGKPVELPPNYDDPDYCRAQDLRGAYGLEHLTVKEVKEIWEAHSNRCSAGWLIANSKEEIERVFNVELQEIK